MDIFFSMNLPITMFWVISRVKLEAGTRCNVMPPTLTYLKTGIVENGLVQVPNAKLEERGQDKCRKDE